MIKSLERWQVFREMRKDANRRNWEYYNQLLWERDLQEFYKEDGLQHIEKSDVEDAFSELSAFYKVKAVLSRHLKLVKALLIVCYAFTAIIILYFLL